MRPTGNLRALGALALAGAALVAGGCGQDTTAGGVITGDTLIVYSNLPLAGGRDQAGRDTVDGEKLALAQAGGKVGGFFVKYVSLDSIPHGGSRPTIARAAANARQAVEDRSTIAYLEELGPGEPGVSVPIIGGAGILQVALEGPRPELGADDASLPAGSSTLARLVAPRSLAGQGTFRAAFRETFGRPATPAALRGHQAMRAVLAAVRAAGARAGDRRVVNRAFLSVPGRETGPAST